MFVTRGDVKLTGQMKSSASWCIYRCFCLIYLTYHLFIQIKNEFYAKYSFRLNIKLFVLHSSPYVTMLIDLPDANSPSCVLVLTICHIAKWINKRFDS